MLESPLSAAEGSRHSFLRTVQAGGGFATGICSFAAPCDRMRCGTGWHKRLRRHLGRVSTTLTSVWGVRRDLVVPTSSATGVAQAAGNGMSRPWPHKLVGQTEEAAARSVKAAIRLRRRGSRLAKIPLPHYIHRHPGIP